MAAAHQRAATEQTAGSGCGCWCFRRSHGTSPTTGQSPSGEAPEEGTPGGFVEKGQQASMHDLYPEAMSQYFLCHLPGLCQHSLPGAQLQLPRRYLYYFLDLCSILNEVAGLMFHQIPIIFLRVKVRVLLNDPQVSMP